MVAKAESVLEVYSIHPIHFVFVYLLCEVVDDPCQCFCHDLGVSAQFVHINVRPGRHDMYAGPLLDKVKK